MTFEMVYLIDKDGKNTREMSLKWYAQGEKGGWCGWSTVRNGETGMR